MAELSMILSEVFLRFFQDSRLAVRQDLSGGEWQLVIRDVAFSDAGEYECQVNTSPVLSHTISLAVVGKTLLSSHASASSVQTNSFVKPTVHPSSVS